MRMRVRMNNLGSWTHFLLVLFIGLSLTAAAVAVPSHQIAFAAKGQTAPVNCLIFGKKKKENGEYHAGARDARRSWPAKEYSRVRCMYLSSDDNSDDDCCDTRSFSGLVDKTSSSSSSSSKSHASSDGQRDTGRETVNSVQLKEKQSDPQSTHPQDWSSPAGKIKREVGSSNSDSSDNEQQPLENLSSEMTLLREELLGTLLARSSGNLNRQVVLRIADEAVRKLMQETAAAATAAASRGEAAAAAAAAEGLSLPTSPSPSSLVRLPPSLLAQDSEISLDETLQTKIRERAYRDRWWHPTATLPYMVDMLTQAFPEVNDSDIIVMFAREAAMLVDEEREALAQVAQTAFGMESVRFYDDEGMAMGSLLRQAMVEVRRNDLNVNELSALLRARYPPLMNFHRELVARTALYLVEMEDRRRRGGR